MKQKSKEHWLFLISVVLMMIGFFFYCPVLTLLSGIYIILSSASYVKSKLNLKKLRYLTLLSVILLCVGCSSSPSQVSATNTTSTETSIQTEITTTTKEPEQSTVPETSEAPSSSLQETSSKEIATSNITSEMKVHFLDVGQGDCELIESNGHFMLISGWAEMNECQG